MRTKLFLGAVCVALGSTIGGLSLAAAAPSHARAAATVIRTNQTITRFVPTGKPGIGTVWSGVAYHVDPTTGKRIGHGDAVCVQFTAGANGSLDCQGDDHLPGGEIREAGIITNPARIEWAIVGGTGRFAQASGTYLATAVGKSTTKAHVTFTIYGAEG